MASCLLYISSIVVSLDITNHVLTIISSHCHYIVNTSSCITIIIYLFIYLKVFLARSQDLLLFLQKDLNTPLETATSAVM